MESESRDLYSANVKSIVFLRRIQATRLASFWMLAARAVRKNGISATMGLVLAWFGLGDGNIAK